jgi:hypothetical protein
MKLTPLLLIKNIRFTPPRNLDLLKKITGTTHIYYPIILKKIFLRKPILSYVLLDSFDYFCQGSVFVHHSDLNPPRYAPSQSWKDSTQQQREEEGAAERRGGSRRGGNRRGIGGW